MCDKRLLRLFLFTLQNNYGSSNEAQLLTHTDALFTKTNIDNVENQMLSSFFQTNYKKYKNRQKTIESI